MELYPACDNFTHRNFWEQRNDRTLHYKWYGTHMGQHYTFSHHTKWQNHL